LRIIRVSTSAAECEAKVAAYTAGLQPGEAGKIMEGSLVAFAANALIRDRQASNNETGRRLAAAARCHEEQWMGRGAERASSGLQVVPIFILNHRLIDPTVGVCGVNPLCSKQSIRHRVMHTHRLLRPIALDWTE
jgi:hypothetical protein